MKKIKLSTFILIILVSVYICGCSNNANEKHTEGIAYETTIEDVANDGIGVQTEDSTWTLEYFTYDCKKKMKCDVLEYSLKGEYHYSIIEKNHSYITNIYVCENGVEFGIRADKKMSCTLIV